MPKLVTHVVSTMSFFDKWAVLAGYFTISVMLMSVALLAIYRIVRCSTRLRLCFQTERGRKHALSGNENLSCTW